MSPVLGSLPAPDIIETLDFETILSAMKNDLKQKLPEWDAADLESDPGVKILEVAAYRELIIRQRVNDAARANLLSYAKNLDLDHLAEFYGLERLEGESDEELRERTVSHIKGFSVGGTSDSYKSTALGSDSDIRDIAVDSPEPGKVRIAVLSKIGDGAADQEMLDAITNAVNAPDTKIITDTIEVIGAEIIPVNVEALIHLYPDAPEEIINTALDSFPGIFDSARELGWNLTKSWIIRQLHLDGVQEVELIQPASNVEVGPFQCVTLADLNLTMGNRVW
jgi:phage-related baseplate assembly protein